MIVEGTHDSRVMQNFVDANSCFIVVASGKGNALGALPLVRRTEPKGIILIVDRDFDFVCQGAVYDTDVVYVDCHDLDLMIFKSPALEKVLRELASPDKMEQFRETCGDLRTYLLSAAAPIGCLRLLSIEENEHLSFDGMSFDFVRRVDLQFEVKEMVQEVLNKSMRSRSENDAFVEKIMQVSGRVLDPWEICVGEDVLQFLTRALCKMIGTQQRNKINWRSVQTHLRLAYERDFFRKSGLYARIKDWEKIQAPFICLTV